MNARLRTAWWCALTVVGFPISAGASASTTPPMWAGVERVLIDCQFDASISSPSLRRSLCDQIVAEAARLTRYPVALAGPQDLSRSPDRLKQLDRQLVLHVAAKALNGVARPKALAVTVRPERLGLNRWQGRATRAMPVALDWRGDAATFKGPVKPLALYLSTPARERDRPPLKAPVRSDR